MSRGLKTSLHLWNQVRLYTAFHLLAFYLGHMNIIHPSTLEDAAAGTILEAEANNLTCCSFELVFPD